VVKREEKGGKRRENGTNLSPDSFFSFLSSLSFFPGKKKKRGGGREREDGNRKKK